MGPSLVHQPVFWASPFQADVFAFHGFSLLERSLRLFAVRFVGDSLSSDAGCYFDSICLSSHWFKSLWIYDFHPVEPLFRNPIRPANAMQQALEVPINIPVS